MKFLFIAEKPSLMMSVQTCYKTHTSEIIEKVGTIDFIALSGHVCTYYKPQDYKQWENAKWHEIDYPMIPSVWGIKAIDNKGKKKTIKQIKNTIRKYDGVIVGTDSDIEGYGIYSLLENYLHIEDMYALRFMESSLTDKEILKSLRSMTDFHKDVVHKRAIQAFLLRARIDWLYGMNTTRLMSLYLQKLMTVGRVKAPTLKLVYDNSMAIDNFVSRKYYIVTSVYDTFKAVLIDENNKNIQFDEKNDIPSIPNDGVVVKKETKRITTHAPQLYDLSDLQAEAGKLYEYSPKEVLDIAQSLYEKHKVLSYPRTQCRYVSDEKAKEFIELLPSVAVFDDLRQYLVKVTKSDIARVMNDKKVVNTIKVEEESHDALLPTTNRPNLNEMTEDERNICHMIYARLLAQFMPFLEEDRTQIVIRHGNYGFATKGKIVVEQGWRNLYKKITDNVIPNVNEGDRLMANKFVPAEQNTMPPKRLTDSSLIDAMKHISKYIVNKDLKKSLENSQGIGTSATRADIIADIIERGYVKKTKKGLFITELGKTYVRSLEGIDILSPIFAAQLDFDMKKVQRGEKDYDMVYNDMVEKLKKICISIENKEQINTQMDELCPMCGSNLINDRYAYKCPNCGGKIPKKMLNVQIDTDTLNKLISGQATKVFSFKKKDGSSFKARLKLEPKDDTYELTFDFSSGLTCPVCGGRNVTLNNGGAFCKCGFKLFRNFCGHTFTDGEIQKLISEKRISNIDDFVSKNNDSTFSANVVLIDGNLSLDFDD